MFRSTDFSSASSMFLSQLKRAFQGGSNEQGEHTRLIDSRNLGGGYTSKKQSEEGSTESPTKNPGKEASNVLYALKGLIVEEKEPIDSSLVNALKENPRIITLLNNPRKVNFDGFKLKLDIKDTDNQAVVVLKQAIENEFKESLKNVDIQSIYADLGVSEFRKSVFEAPTIRRLQGKLKSNERYYDFKITIYYLENKQDNGHYYTINRSNNKEYRSSYMSKERLTLIKGLSTDAVSKQLQINEQDNDETRILSDYKNLETIYVKLYNGETPPISRFLRGN